MKIAHVSSVPLVQPGHRKLKEALVVVSGYHRPNCLIASS